MTPGDVPAVLAAQEPGSVVGLAKVFPQSESSFPRETVGRRWLDEIESQEVECLVVEQDHAVVGFAAVRADEFLHFGIAMELWGTGVAQAAHDAVLERIGAAGYTRAWLRVFTDNERGRRFYERVGWAPTGERSNSTFAPYPELLHYQREIADEAGASRQ
jgi:RimJ/RimL family protein N-acetyltransferase